MTEHFLDYLKVYIAELTKSQDTFFLAITDIDSELFNDINLEEFKEYHVVIVNRQEYANAVKLRNNKYIKKIVILSTDSIKSIDSLKDFVEYPIIPQEKSVFWIIIEKIFNLIEVETSQKNFIGCLLDNLKIDIKKLLEYLSDCISKYKLINKNLTNKLTILELWKSNNEKLKIQTLKNIIRYSDPEIIEERLSKAILQGKLEKQRESISSYLSSDKIKDLLKKFYFEDIESYLKVKSNKRKNIKKEIILEEHTYDYSYEKLFEEGRKDIENFEKEIIDNEELYGLFQDVIDKFVISEEEILRSIEEIQSIIDNVKMFSFLENQKQILLDLLEQFKEQFNKAMGKKAKSEIDKEIPLTPVLLYQYCFVQKEVVILYFKILSMLMTNTVMINVYNSTNLIESIQNIFCKTKEEKLIMPFYHPMISLYFMYKERIFQQVLQYYKKEKLENIEEILYKLIEKENFQFPIRFLYSNGELYQLDHSSLSEIQEIKFYNQKNRITNSIVNFKLLNRLIENYIRKTPLLCEINITIIDLDDLDGILLLHRKLKNLLIKEKDSYAIYKIIINIISKKEEELKKQLLNLYNIGIDEPSIYFKFTSNRYIKNDELDLTNIIKESDILFFADTNMIYSREKLMKYEKNPNLIIREISNFNLENQITYLLNGEKQIELLWDTLHKISVDGELILSLWNNQELHTDRLNTIRKKVEKKEKELFSAIIITTNRNLLKYHKLDEKYYEINKYKFSGKETMIINFSQDIQKNFIQDNNISSIEFSFSSFLEEFLEEEELGSMMRENDEEKTIKLEINYDKQNFQFICTLNKTEEDDNKEERKNYYSTLLEDILNFAFCKGNILAKRFHNILINQLYEKASNYRIALIIYYLDRVGIGQINKEQIIYKEEQGEFENKIHAEDCTKIINFQDMIEFFETLKCVDESAITQFQTYYKKSMLEQVIKANKQDNLLPTLMIENMKTIYERINK